MTAHRLSHDGHRVEALIVEAAQCDATLLGHAEHRLGIDHAMGRSGDTSSKVEELLQLHGINLLGDWVGDPA